MLDAGTKVQMLDARGAYYGDTGVAHQDAVCGEAAKLGSFF